MLINFTMRFFKSYVLLIYCIWGGQYIFGDKCSEITLHSEHNEHDRLLLHAKSVVPTLDGTIEGDSGKICVIGGSVEYTGAPYFSAITALRTGADLVYVITTENAALAIKSYSPELIVYPFLNDVTASKISVLLQKMDVVIIGPGLGREESTAKLITGIMDICRTLAKPLVIDADGLYFVTKNITLVKDYPLPGVILTPNYNENRHLVRAVGNNQLNYLGPNVFVLAKGQEDKFYSSTSDYNWTLSDGGSGRRAGGQGDILSGCLATFFNWTLRKKHCTNQTHSQLAASIASFAAAKFTRTCNQKAYKILGRSMIAGDMLNYIHFVFEDLFEK